MRSALHRLAAEEAGTAMTEFVITLPIFLTIFLGIVGLSRLQDAATRAHPEANRQMWEHAFDSANSEPNSDWADPAAVGEYDEAPRSDNDTFGYDETKFRRLYDYGTLGEAMSGANFEETKNWRFRLEESDQDCPRCARDWIYDNDRWIVRSGYAEIATKDEGVVREPLPRVDPEFQSMRATFDSARPKSRLAYGAGSRYGIATGAAARDVTWQRWNVTFRPQYQVTAPSRTLEKNSEAFGSVAAARVEFERWEWADIPGFQVEDVFDFRFGLSSADFNTRRH